MENKMAGKKIAKGNLGQNNPSDDVGRKHVKPSGQVQGKMLKELTVGMKPREDTKPWQRSP
jgi:hypothetical protein